MSACERIQYPNHYSEFEIQAELYFALKNQGVLVRGEVNASITHEEGNRCRMDLVIFNQAKSAVAIIECKKRRYSKAWSNGPRYVRDNRQFRKYSTFDLPVFQCLSIDDVPSVAEAIMEEIAEIPFA